MLRASLNIENASMSRAPVIPFCQMHSRVNLSKEDEGLHPYEKVAIKLADFLFGQQVISHDVRVEIDHQGYGRVAVELLRSQPPVVIELKSRPFAKEPVYWLTGQGSPVGPLGHGDFFRVNNDGCIGTIPGFGGLTRQESSPSDARASGEEQSATVFQRTKAAMAKVPYLRRVYHALRKRVSPDPARDLSQVAGVTFRLEVLNKRQLLLRAEDRGGFLDEYLNAEGLTYPRQVPGNYYCAAYAGWLFSWLYLRTGDASYAAAAHEAIIFVERHYPQYPAAGIVWHHSDFDNAALLDARVLLESVGCEALPASLIPAPLVERMVADRYDPTNVYALRFHWRSARCLLTQSAEDRNAAEEALGRVGADQTLEGLIHDNSAAYQDAHDLSYHQYSLACLAQGLAYTNHARAREIFLRGARFSLELITPNGEVAYVGRAANNIHHSASAILTFETAAYLVGRDTPLGQQFRRAARLALQYLKPYQQGDGMLPTAMNDQIAKRVAWNHCETPYNALVGFMLLKARQMSDGLQSGGEARLPMESPQHVFVAPNSGYASCHSESLYAVLFGGCAKSYAWSEGKHVTGIAGLAQVGRCQSEAVIPILDAPPDSADDPITDLPIINGELPFGRGEVFDVASGLPGFGYAHAYGGARLRRIYVFVNNSIIVVTRITSEAARPVKVRGAVAWTIRCDRGWAHVRTRDKLLVSGPDVQLDILGLYASVPWNRSRRCSSPTTNPRGLAARIELWDFALKQVGDEAWICHEIRFVDPDQPRPSRIRVRRADDALILYGSNQLFRIDTRAWKIEKLKEAPLP
jgi:hypothetical protein